MSDEMKKGAINAFFQERDKFVKADIRAALINTGRLVTVEADWLCDIVIVQVYDDQKRIGEWVGKPAAVVAFYNNKKVYNYTCPNGDQHCQTIKYDGDNVILTSRVKYSKWQNYRSTPKTVLTKAEWESVAKLSTLCVFVQQKEIG
jgi:hypothetical protein